MLHVSIIDWAFQVFQYNLVNRSIRRCQIGKIRVGKKEIDPKMFEKRKGEIWS